MTVTIITLFAALASTVIGVGTFIHFFLMILQWPRATGTVIGNVADLRSTEGSEYAHFPRIEFQAANGQTYEVRGDIGLSDEWPIGQSVELRYRVTDPKQTTIMTSWQRLLFSTVFVGFAIAFWYAWYEMPPEL